MLQTIIIGSAILFIAILLMGVRIFFTKKGKFPDFHISNHQAMKDRGISCATSQDRAARGQQNLLDKLEIKKYK